RFFRLSLHDSPIHERKGSSSMRSFHLFLFSLAAATSLAGQNVPVEPGAGSWRTFIVSDVATLRLDPPPDDARSREEIDALKAAAQNRDAAAMQSLRYWNAGAPSYRWIQIAQQEVSSHNLGGPAATRAMSLVAVAMYDATIAAWDTKYTYLRPRPSQLDPTLT